MYECCRNTSVQSTHLACHCLTTNSSPVRTPYLKPNFNIIPELSFTFHQALNIILSRFKDLENNTCRSPVDMRMQTLLQEV